VPGGGDRVARVEPDPTVGELGLGLVGRGGDRGGGVGLGPHHLLRIGRLGEERGADLADRQPSHDARVARRQGRGGRELGVSGEPGHPVDPTEIAPAPQEAAGRGRQRRIVDATLGAGTDRGRHQPAGQLGGGDQRVDLEGRGHGDDVGAASHPGGDRRALAAGQLDVDDAGRALGLTAAQEPQARPARQPAQELVLESVDQIAGVAIGARRQDHRGRQVAAAGRADPARPRRRDLRIGAQGLGQSTDVGPALGGRDRDRPRDDRAQAGLDRGQPGRGPARILLGV
jgi:hypothetical protein